MPLATVENALQVIVKDFLNFQNEEHESFVTQMEMQMKGKKMIY